MLKSDFIINVVDYMSDDDLEELNIPIITIETGIWSNITWWLHWKQKNQNRALTVNIATQITSVLY